MILDPNYTYEITGVISEWLDKYFHKQGLKCAIRIMTNDTRNENLPPEMCSGE